MALAFNVEPYWDDFKTVDDATGLSPKDIYQRILFRPGKAIQARELTQLQSILQNQISSHGDWSFKDGNVVVPGALHLHNKIDYIKLSATTGFPSPITNLIDTEFTDGTSVAKVIYAAEADGSDPITLWVRYISGDVFSAGAGLTATGITATIAASGTTPIGFGSLVSIEDGIYYIKKHFVTVKAKTLILSKYASDISFDIGLKVTESFIGSGEDSSLNDNATGTTNASAPGAHRYSITTELTTQAVNATDSNFVLITRLESGIITKHARTPDYNHLEDHLARRTFDESGNYYVNPFKALVKAHADPTKLTLAVEPSKAYVRGYEIQTLGTTNVHFDKAQTSERVEGKVTEITHNNYIEVTNLVMTPDIINYRKINILDNVSTIIATCRPRSIERVSGNGGLTTDRFRIHIFDYQDESSNTTGMSTAASLESDDKASGTNPIAWNFTGAIESYNTGPDSLIYKLPYERIKTLDSSLTETPDFDYRYETNRIVGGSIEVTGTTVQFSTSTEGETFGDKTSNQNWILINETNDTPGGEEIIAANDINFSNANKTVTISNLPSGQSNPYFVRLIAPMTRIGRDDGSGSHKNKTLSAEKTKTFPGSTDFTGIGQAFPYADIYEIISIEETSGGADVMEHFDLDNGQRDDYYDVGRIKLKTTSNYAGNVGITIKYKYFEHVGNADFFTRDSYSIPYENIPKFGDIELRSAVDFRPRIDDTGSNFYDSGASTSFAPVRYSQFTTDIQFYLPRIDKVYLDSKGEFGISPGVPSRYPEKPEIPSDAMHLYTMSIPAYTLNAAEVDVEFIDNRRYTMRDIGKIEKRLNRIEYYSVLSFLESEAQNKQILDDDNNPRWKAGYLVDGFSNTRMSKSDSPEYRASIDIHNRILRPPFSQGNVPLSYHNTSDTQKTGDLVTLPYTTTPIITQTQYSGQINVNPYDVFNWTGTMTLTPSSDEWRDVDRRPEVVINNDGEFNAMMANLEPQIGTIWGEWSTNWSGNSSWEASGRRRDLIETGVQERSGVQQTIEVQTSVQSTGDRIVEVNFIPFMRTRLVAFSATSMKPATQVYAFFDNTDVSNYVSTNASSYEPLIGINTVTSHPATQTTLTTDANGAVSGTFLIPNNSTLNFSTGDKEFKLTQSSTNDDEVTTTSATAMYTAAGLLETVENVVISTRIPLLQRTAVNQQGSNQRRTLQTTWVDPLAQSILLDKAAFITSLDLYFTASDPAIPVQIQIRKMENGFPTQEVVPFSNVMLNPYESDNTTRIVKVDGSATRFTFPSLVYLQDGVEYAIVIMANSNKYLVNYAQIGDEDQAGYRISQQPYNGVLFKSQNASTWTPDQNKDLRFVLNRAVFDISQSRTCVLRNDTLPSRALIKNPLTTTNNSSDVTVAHRDHGMSIGDSVTLDECTATNGHSTANLEKSHTITAVTRDTYTFASPGTGNGTGIGGGTDCQATQYLAWNTIHPIIQQVVLPDTTQTWTIQDSNESAGAITQTTVPVLVNEDYTPLLPKIIKSDATIPTLQYNGIFTSTSDYISPMLDLERCSAITVSNRIDNVTSGETNASTGANLAKYVTNKVELYDNSDALKIWLDINRPNGTHVDLYYKSGNTAATFDTQPWVAASPTTGNGYVVYSDGIIYNETIYDIAPAATFTIFQLKIVMRSTNTSTIPKCQSLRAISLKA